MQAPPPPAPRWRTAERSPSPPLRRQASLSPAARGCSAERPLSDASSLFVSSLHSGALLPPCTGAGSPAFKSPGAATTERIRSLLLRHAADGAAVAQAADEWLDGPQPQRLPLSPPPSPPRSAARTPLGSLSAQPQDRGAKPTPTRLAQGAENVQFCGWPEPLPTPLRNALPTPARAAPPSAFTFASPPSSAVRMPALFSVWQDEEDEAEDAAAELAADGLAAKRRTRTALRAFASAVAQSRTQEETAARAHSERTAAQALRGWRAVFASAQRRTSLSLVSQLRTAATHLRSALHAWASVARDTALLRDQHGAADAIARHGRLARAFAAWRAAAACRAPRLLALRPLVVGWRAAAASLVATSQAQHAAMRRRRYFLAWAAVARACSGVGARKARAHAALATFQGASSQVGSAAALCARRGCSTLHLIRERGCRAQQWAARRRRVRTTSRFRHTHAVWRLRRAASSVCFIIRACCFAAGALTRRLLRSPQSCGGTCTLLMQRLQLRARRLLRR